MRLGRLTGQISNRKCIAQNQTGIGPYEWARKVLLHRKFPDRNNRDQM